jgi:hypothetical protein
MSETLAADSRGRTPVWFWVIGLALVLYVAVCTPQRENELLSDAWEHHRAILTLTRHLWKPGNPTYASDLPSVRYSPYAVFWAIVCRATHLTPYNALSVAAVVNTILLVLAVRALLVAFSEAPAAAAVLVVMVTLYGGAPQWANSYALADLPVQQVNPSAFSFALVLFSWAIFRRITVGRGNILKWASIVLLMTIAMLDHGMTGAFGMVGLIVIATLAPAGTQGRMLTGFAGIIACVAALCLCWPWYGFLAAARWQGDPQYWFSTSFLQMQLTQWIVPAVAGALLALPLFRRPMVRFCIAGGVLSIGAGLASYVTHSPTLSRFPLPGLIYFHIMMGVFAHETGIFRPSTWPARLKQMFAPFPQGSFAITQTLLAMALLGCLAPQLKLIATEPRLARPYLVKLLHRGKDQQEHLPRDLAKLLKGVGEHDVVLSDIRTSWLVPSYNGRIVSAIHYELFVPNQPRRWHDVIDFFTPGDSELHREHVVREYDVRWIVLDKSSLDKSVYDALLRPSAVVAHVDTFVLMDASKWLAAAPIAKP